MNNCPVHHPETIPPINRMTIPAVAGLFSGFVLAIASPSIAAATAKTTLFVPLDDSPGWHDMAYLAAIPASEIANESGASLVAIDPAAGLGPEIKDYLRRYKPDSLCLLSQKTSFDISQVQDQTGAKLTVLPAASAEEAALLLSRTFWKSSSSVVVCANDDYESALAAAPLAALLKAPLLYTAASGFSAETNAEILRLRTKRVLSIGSMAPGENSIHFAGAMEIMQWVRNEGIDVDYIAAVNPLDRSTSKVRKLSLVGAQLAAGRKGLVAPLPFEVEWKKPFKSMPGGKDLPERFLNQQHPVRTGALQVGKDRTPYVLTGNPKGTDQTLFIDHDGSGNFTGPLRSGDPIELDDRKWTLSLGAGSSYHDSDVHITWPKVDEVNQRLQDFYQILGLPPTYLCLIGLPDAIPQGIVRGHQSSPDVTTDLPYAMLDGEPSARIAVGRVVAEDVRFGSLYASRVLTYRDLLDKEWMERACQAEWENSFAPLFANVGFDSSYRLKDEDIPWAEKPTKGNRGKPGPGFAEDSPVTRTNLLCHMNHSWNFELGRMMKWDATALISPALVESGGCGTTSLDRSAPGQLIVEGASGAQSPELATKHRSVVSRLFRLGAVSFSGGSREMTAQQLPLRQTYWSGILSGQSAGIAHRNAQNAGFLILKHLAERPAAGGYRHNLHAKTLLGDPAVTVHLPGAMRTAPAMTRLESTRLILRAPERWEIVKMFVPPDWKKWTNRDIFVARATGAYSLSYWGPEGRDVEEPYVMAEFQTERNIKSITPVHPQDVRMGWSNTWHTTRNRDGSYSHRLGARMIDFDQETGKILDSVNQIEFVIGFE